MSKERSQVYPNDPTITSEDFDGENGDFGFNYYKDGKLIGKGYASRKRGFEKIDLYNQKGHICQTFYREGKCDYYDIDGNVKRTNHYKYALPQDPDDFIRDCLTGKFDFEKNIIYSDIYRYDNDGKIGSIERCGPDGTLSEMLFYKYGENGSLDTIEHRNDPDHTGISILSQIDFCDESGRVDHSEHYDKTGKVIETSSWSYDGDDSWNYSGDDFSDKVDFYNDQGKLIRTEYCKGDVSFATRFYDEKGRVAHEESYAANINGLYKTKDHKIWESTTEYKDNGEYTKDTREYYLQSGMLKGYNISFYDKNDDCYKMDVYDRHGKLIQANHYDADLSDNDDNIREKYATASYNESQDDEENSFNNEDDRSVAKPNKSSDNTITKEERGAYADLVYDDDNNNDGDDNAYHGR